MLILILDTETTGLQPDAQVIEIAGIVFDTATASRVCSVATLFPCDDNPAQSVNHIDPRATRWINPGPALELLREWAEEVDYLMAYNAEFDRSRVESLGIGLNRTWICAQHDVNWPRASRQGGGLIHAALECGVPVLSPHRAMTDCRLVADMLISLGGSLGDILNQAADRAESPTLTVFAEISYDDRELAKSHGFRWNKELRKWTRQIKSCDVAKLPFRVTVG